MNQIAVLAFLQIRHCHFSPVGQLIGRDCFKGGFFDIGGRMMQLALIVVEEKLNFCVINLNLIVLICG